MYHSTECSLENVFYPTPPAGGRGWATGRIHDVRLFGQAKFPFYPLRYKVKNGMEKGTIIGKPMSSRNWW